MRIHVHNGSTGHLAPISPEEWQAAGGGAHDVTFGEDREAFRAVADEVEVLLSSVFGLKNLLPFDAPNLRIVSCLAAGLDMLAPFDWLPSGITLLNNSGTHGPKAAEYGSMAMLMLANRMPARIVDQQAARWAKHATGMTIAGKTAVIVGFGAIGQACAAAAHRAGLHVIAVRRSAGRHPDCDAVVATDDLAEVLPRADYLLLALPRTAVTEGLIDRDKLALLPTHAGVINIGRGGVLDETALCDLLDAGELGGAVLDVFAAEPLPEDSRLWTTPNLIVTPHMSSDDPETHNRRSIQVLLRNLDAFAVGLPLPNAFDTIAGTRSASLVHPL